MRNKKEAGRDAPPERRHMANEEKKFKTTGDMLFKGAILQSYSKSMLLSVNPVPDIEKVRFSVVKLGTGGKEALDVYLSIEEMRLLCHEIDSGVAARRIAADKGAWPQAYQYVKGVNGSKKLNIGGGDSGVRAQAQEKGEGGQWKRMMAIIQPQDLYTMSFFYGIVMGLRPVYGFYQNYVDMFWKGVEERKQYHVAFSEELDGDYVPPAPEDGPGQGAQAQAAQPGIQNEQPRQAQMASDPNRGSMTAWTAAPCTTDSSKGEPWDIFQLKEDKTGAQHTAVFQARTKRELGNSYEEFKERANAGPTMLSFSYYRGNDGRLYVLKLDKTGS